MNDKFTRCLKWFPEALRSYNMGNIEETIL